MVRSSLEEFWNCLQESRNHNNSVAVQHLTIQSVKLIRKWTPCLFVMAKKQIISVVYST